MTDTPTPEQQKQWTATMFDLVAEGYDNPAQRLFPFTADRLVNKLQPLSGYKVLDIATGTGHAAMAAAQAVGRDGRVHAIDLSEGMLSRAQQNIDKMQLPNIDLHVMDAEALEFRRQYFDMAMCSFGLFFLPDMLKGLQSWWRVLKPGGRYFISDLRRDMNPAVRALVMAFVKPGKIRPGLATSINAAYTVNEIASVLEVSELCSYEVRKTIIGLAVEGKK